MHKPYPSQEFELAYDPVIMLHADADLRQQEADRGSTNVDDWSRYYLTSLGNVLSWNPVVPTRAALGRLIHLDGIPKYVDDQPGKRLAQEATPAESSLGDHPCNLLCGLVGALRTVV